MHRAVVALLAGVLAACNGLPSVHVPQAEQAVQATHGGGERLRAHQRCLAAGEHVEDLVHCMETEGYSFVPRTPGFPGDECWTLRDAARDDAPPPPHCFEHAADAPH